MRHLRRQLDLAATLWLVVPPGARGATLSYRATLVTAGDDSLSVGGPLDSPWPTAGPTRP